MVPKKEKSLAKFEEVLRIQQPKELKKAHTPWVIANGNENDSCSHLGWWIGKLVSAY